MTNKYEHSDQVQVSVTHFDILNAHTDTDETRVSARVGVDALLDE